MHACEVQRARVVPCVCVGVGERIVDNAVFAAGTRDRGGACVRTRHPCACLGASLSEEKKNPTKDTDKNVSTEEKEWMRGHPERVAAPLTRSCFALCQFYRQREVLLKTPDQ
jgi:hypothetical protein